MLSLKNYETILYQREAFAIPYIDMDQGEIIVINDGGPVADSLLLIPSRDELIPYNKAMYHYLDERNLYIPMGISAAVI